MEDNNLNAECSSSTDSGSSNRSYKQGRQYPGLTGLCNSGNTCYMNAVLQCLCSTIPLVEYCLSGKYQADIVRGKGEVASAFSELMTDMWLGEFEYIFPEELRDAVGKMYPPFSASLQQDAQELLIYLLNGLHDDLKKTSKGKQPRRTMSRTSSGMAANLSGESSIISDLFEGQLSYVTVCLACQNETYSKDINTVFSLPIPPGIKCSLQDCLELFFRQDTLTWNNQIHCSVCKTNQDSLVRASITKAPDVLILHLKRFECQGRLKRKLQTYVHFPLENLNLSHHVSTVLQKPLRYTLYAVVNHVGDLDCGHYTAYRKNVVTQRWHKFDDEMVSDVPESSVETRDAYILFYSRYPFQVPTW